MSVIHSGNHPKAHWPGVKEWFGLKYDELPVQYTDLFEVMTSDKKYEEIVEATGFGLGVIKPEGESISYDTAQQGYTSRFTHVVYGLGFIVTEEEMEDNLYPQLARSRAGRLAFSMRITKEKVHAQVYNRAFNSTYVGGDGKELIATDHPRIGGTWSNELAVPADLSEAAIEDMLIQISQATDARGLNIGLEGQKLIIPNAYRFDAVRILKSVGQNDTANNAVNALKLVGALPGGAVTNTHLTSDSAWFIRTNAEEGMISFQRRTLKFDKDNDFDTSNAKAKATERYAVGWGDPRALYASAGI